MKRIITLVILALIFIAGSGTLVFVPVKEKEEMKAGSLKVVAAPAQEQAMEHPYFKVEAFEPVIPSGTNVALTAKATANNMGAGFVPKKAIDDKLTTYYEGAPGEFPNELTLDLKDVYSVHAVKLLLCPDAVWAKRVQTIEILAGTEEGALKTVVAKADYEFDPKTGNERVIEFPAENMRFVMIRFYANTGAVGGQAAEVQIYAD